MPTSTEQIIRCIKSDMPGDLLAGALYCESIARNASLNPWADPTDAYHYSEAAKRLRAELQERKDLCDSIQSEA